MKSEGLRFRDGISTKRDTAGNLVVRARIRLNGKIVERRDQVSGSVEDAKCRREQLKQELRSGSPVPAQTATRGLATFGDLITFRGDRAGFGGMDTFFNILKRDIGDCPNDPDVFLSRFDEYLGILSTEPTKQTGKLRSPKTLNHYIEAAGMTWSYASKPAFRPITGVRSNPLAKYDKHPVESRDRVLTIAETTALFTELTELNSPLYWPARFSIRNPIRQGDLICLNRKNLDIEHPWVHYMPHKTRRKKPREACLVCIEKEILDYWDRLPQDCFYLFPWMNEDGTWRQLREEDFGEHWRAVLSFAAIDGFHWHDLKHMAITFMLDHGFCELDLKNLGIQYDPKMVERYYHHDAEKGLKVWKAYSGQDLPAELAALRDRAMDILTKEGFSQDQLREIGLKFCPKLSETAGHGSVLVPDWKRKAA